jgi:hypothetical protein
VFFSKGGWLIPARERALIDSISSGAATYGEGRAAGTMRLPSTQACGALQGLCRSILQTMHSCGAACHCTVPACLASATAETNAAATPCCSVCKSNANAHTTH